jgi:uroporphyrinogen decarboxylase
MEKSGADILSVDHTVVLGQNAVLAKTKKGIQGNLFQGCLLGEWKDIEQRARQVLMGANAYPKYIFNLSHGVLPATPVDHLKRLVEYVHQFDRRQA